MPRTKLQLKITGDSGKVRRRQFIEQTIAMAVVKEGLRRGYILTVDNGDSSKSESEQTISGLLSVMFETDEESIYFYQNKKCIGWVKFVYGNDGYDVISDYSVSIGHLVDGPKIRKIVDEFELNG